MDQESNARVAPEDVRVVCRLEGLEAALKSFKMKVNPPEICPLEDPRQRLIDAISALTRR